LPRSTKKRVTLRLGTRASPLAKVQSEAIARQLRRVHRAQGLRVELLEITTHGDRDRRSALQKFGGRGVFVKELEHALSAGRVDFAVHSLKDLPTRQPRGLTLAAVTRREDVRDVVATRAGERLAKNACVGSGSPRRRAQLLARHPCLKLSEIRGNVETRLRKVAEGACDATVLAHAGLTRLGMRVPARGRTVTVRGADGRARRVRLELLPLKAMLPAPGQGALGLECRARDERTRKLLRALHDPCAAACVEAERACLTALGGGCHLPLGALATVERDGSLRLRAVLAAEGGAAARVDLCGSAAQPQKLGLRAARLLSKTPAGRARREPAKP
jgi:hydroxymethylbilane synthase